MIEVTSAFMVKGISFFQTVRKSSNQRVGIIDDDHDGRGQIEKGHKDAAVRQRLKKPPVKAVLVSSLFWKRGRLVMAQESGQGKSAHQRGRQQHEHRVRRHARKPPAPLQDKCRYRWRHQFPPEVRW
jgi:hypothetical protein